MMERKTKDVRTLQRKEMSRRTIQVQKLFQRKGRQTTMSKVQRGQGGCRMTTDHLI